MVGAGSMRNRSCTRHNQSLSKKASSLSGGWNRPGFVLGRCGFFERALLDSEVGVEIDLSGLDRFMPEPKSDDTAVDAGFEELDGGCVTQDVRGIRSC